jgi:hypothetical protein
MKDCPTCGAHVDGDYCQRCNTGKRGQKGVNPDRNCPDCGRQGSISDNMDGSPPWFCGDHYRSHKNLNAQRTGPPRGWQALRELAAGRWREPGEEG